jgi:hypothetical protein
MAVWSDNRFFKILMIKYKYNYHTSMVELESKGEYKNGFRGK